MFDPQLIADACKKTFQKKEKGWRVGINESDQKAIRARRLYDFLVSIGAAK